MIERIARLTLLRHYIGMKKMSERGVTTHTFKAGEGEARREYELVGIGPCDALDCMFFAAEHAEKMSCTLDEVDLQVLTREVMPEGFEHITDVTITGGDVPMPDAHALIVGHGRDRRLVRRTTVH